MSLGTYSFVFKLLNHLKPLNPKPKTHNPQLTTQHHPERVTPSAVEERGARGDNSQKSNPERVISSSSFRAQSRNEEREATHNR